MKVILTQNIDRLGKAGDCLTVKDGYARNYLFPKNMAQEATPANMKTLDSLKKKQTEEAGKSYACGEEGPSNLVQPDYGQFFPFAFFFTILHVFALMIATVPVTTPGTFAIAVIYISGILVGLSILFRK